LGGSNLAINANTDHPDAAYALVEYLTRPEQMIERARAVGQFPARERLYQNGTLADAIEIEPATAHRIISHAVARPVTPVYAELSEILQVHLHRVLSGQEEPRNGLVAAAAAMRQILERSGLGPLSLRGGGRITAFANAFREFGAPAHYLWTRTPPGGG